MPDYSTAELALGAGGTVAVSTFLFLMLQAVKDWLPTLEGRAALSVLYGLSLVVAMALIAPTSPDWTDFLTYLAVAVVTVSVSIVAKGIYSQLFKVSVAGIPPSSDATVPKEAVTEPYEAERRKPIAYTRPLTNDEEAAVSRGKGSL